MKIINLDQFLALPENTLFSKYAPCFFGELSIKGKSLNGTRDFCFQQIADAIKCTGSSNFSAKLFLAEQAGDSVEMDFNCQGRDGCFEDEQLFAVWELKDIQQLIERLVVCLPVAQQGGEHGL